MHATPSGRGPRVPSISAAQKEAQRFSQHVDRKLSAIRPGAAAGYTPGSTRAVADASGGAGLINVAGWSFTKFDWPDSEAPTLLASTSGHFNVSVSGWYSVRGHVGIGWSSPPAEVTYLLNPATTTAMSDSAQYVGTVPVAASGDLFLDIPTSSHFYYGAGQDPSAANVGLLGLDVEWVGGATPSFVEVWLDVTRTG